MSLIAAMSVNAFPNSFDSTTAIKSMRDFIPVYDISINPLRTVYALAV